MSDDIDVYESRPFPPFSAFCSLSFLRAFFAVKFTYIFLEKENLTMTWTMKKKVRLALPFPHFPFPLSLCPRPPPHFNLSSRNFI